MDGRVPGVPTVPLVKFCVEGEEVTHCAAQSVATSVDRTREVGRSMAIGSSGCGIYRIYPVHGGEILHSLTPPPSDRGLQTDAPSNTPTPEDVVQFAWAGQHADALGCLPAGPSFDESADEPIDHRGQGQRTNIAAESQVYSYVSILNAISRNVCREARARVEDLKQYVMAITTGDERIFTDSTAFESRTTSTPRSRPTSP